jgi:hypothetical protein
MIGMRVVMHAPVLAALIVISAVRMAALFPGLINHLTMPVVAVTLRKSAVGWQANMACV